MIQMDLELIQDLYSKGYSHKQIGTQIGVSSETIRTRLNGLGVMPRLAAHISKESFDTEFFKKPNLINCYWAGFIAADGCITDREKHSKALAINLNEIDIEQLKRFVEDIQYTGKISKYKNQTQLRINCFNKCADDLETHFSITPRKTYTLQPPNISNENLVKSYIQGYIDGDGWIGINKSNILKLDIVCNLNIAEWIKSQFDNYIPTTKNNSFYHYENVVSYRITGKRAIDICKWIDSNNLRRLDRKWNKIYEWEKKLDKRYKCNK